MASDTLKVKTEDEALRVIAFFALVSNDAFMHPVITLGDNQYRMQCWYCDGEPCMDYRVVWP